MPMVGERKSRSERMAGKPDMNARVCDGPQPVRMQEHLVNGRCLPMPRLRSLGNSHCGSGRCRRQRGRPPSNDCGLEVTELRCTASAGASSPWQSHQAPTLSLRDRLRKTVFI